MNRKPKIYFIVTLAQILVSICLSQELEPRRWTHLPVGITVTGGGYARTEGEIFLNPVLNIEDAEFSVDSYVLKFVHAFELLGKTAQISLADAYRVGRWEGTRDGAAITTERDGFSDPIVRFAVNLLGAPALKGSEFRDYRISHNNNTIVGAALILLLPFGEYMDDRLINLGNNRYTIRPQLGVLHSRGSWMMELTGSVWCFFDNDDFWNGNNLENSPLYTLQGHTIYTLKSKLWFSGSFGYGYGSESTINGVNKDDHQENILWAAAVGMPVSRKASLKFIWISKRTQEDLGSDSDSFAVAGSYIW